VDRVVVVTNSINKELKMKTVKKIAIGVTTVLGLGVAVATVYAQQGPLGNGMGQGMMRGGMMHGHMTEQNSDMKIMRELMTPSERLAMIDKMMDAKTLEERQAIMTANHTEMEKRAKEKGITLPAGHGPQMAWNKNCG
jgi:Spy/CpxP family protein refolding chaperone